MLKSLLVELDRILRGEKTRMSALQEGRIDVSIRRLTPLLIALGMIAGLCIGTFALLHPDGPRWMQLVASAVKVPLLFLLTLIITFPSLYVFNALVGSRLEFRNLLRLLTAALAVTLTMLAAWGPIVAFFSVSTESYSFMVLLNVAVFGLAGLLGLKFLLQTLHRMTVSDEQYRARPDRQGFLPQPQQTESPEQTTAVSDTDVPDPGGPLDELEGIVLGGHVKLVFNIWVVIFGLVGAQMGWVLRPFIGNPNQDFTWFRPRESNFFTAVWETIGNLITGS